MTGPFPDPSIIHDERAFALQEPRSDDGPPVWFIAAATIATAIIIYATWFGGLFS